VRRPGSSGLAAFGFLLLGLSACESFQPQPIVPEQNAARLQTRSLEDASLRTFVESHLSSSAGNAALSAWNVDALTLAAFYFHPELDVARAHWAVAEAGRVTAGARPGMAANVTPGYNATNSTPTPRLVSVTVDLTLETAGKRGYRIAQADELAEVARLNVASVAWQVHSRVRSRLLDLYAALESDRLLREQQGIQAQNLRIVEAQFSAGAISAFERTQARLDAASARLALSDAERREGEARAQLAGAIGVPASALDNENISFADFESLPSEPDPAQSRQQALMNRPDILGSLAEYAASQSALQLEIARQYPDINLGPGYEYDQGDNKWSIGLSVSFPADLNRGPIAEARARREEAAARFNALQASVLEEIDVAAAAYRAATRKQADSNAMLEDLARQEGVAQGMLKAGEISGSDLAALRLQLSASALVRLDALIQAQTAIGQLRDAVQSPRGLPDAIWEQPPRAAESTSRSPGP